MTQRGIAKSFHDNVSFTLIERLLPIFNGYSCLKNT